MAEHMDEQIRLQEEETLKKKLVLSTEQNNTKSVLSIEQVSPNYKGKHPVSMEELAKRRAEKKRVYECSDPAVNPNHYKSKNGLEVIDCIEAFTDGLSGLEAVCVANILKYVCRYKKKNGLQDLYKSRWYLEKLIKTVEEQEKKHETKNLSGGRDNRSDQRRTVVVEEQSQE